MASSLFFASSAADLCSRPCHQTARVRSQCQPMFIQNCQTIHFDIIRPAKGNSLDVVQLSKSSVLIMRDDDADASCVLLLEKIVRRLTDHVRPVAPQEESGHRIQFPSHAPEPDKVAISRP